MSSGNGIGRSGFLSDGFCDGKGSEIGGARRLAIAVT